ncbi:hypothetical protein [Clostridium polynesiense]|uniref:hypothetical protein n=1 Tax=Clostridium polynesiense TaxID=1325933 RepID=UPI00058EC9AF|nr:hypothetical protein [Clostridium polynesiense]
MTSLLILLLSWFITIHLLKVMLYYNRVGVIAIRRKSNTIYTIISLVTLIRYYKSNKIEAFKSDCKIFFRKLDKGKIYNTNTHMLILKEIKKCSSEVIYEKTKKKRMILEKLIIGNTKGLLKKHQYYKVYFKV